MLHSNCRGRAESIAAYRDRVNSTVHYIQLKSFSSVNRLFRLFQSLIDFNCRFIFVFISLFVSFLPSYMGNSFYYCTQQNTMLTLLQLQHLT